MPRVPNTHVFLPALALLVIPALACAQMVVPHQTLQPSLDALPPIHSKDPEFQDPTNAALLYSRAWLLIHNDTFSKVSDAMQGKDANWIPDAALRKMLLDNQTGISVLLRASRLPIADFGVEYSQGIGALLPHLGQMRASARLLAADAHRAVADNQPDAAAVRVAAIFALAQHCTHDRLLISSLVCIAIHNLAVAQTDYLINSGTLTESGRTALLAATDRFPQADPFGVKASIRGERFWCTVWLREQCKGPNGAQVFTTQILPLIDGAPEGKPENVEDFLKLKALDQAGITAELDKADQYYTDTLAVFDTPDAPARLNQLGEDVKSGKYGLIAKHVVPAMTKSYESNAKAIARQADVVNKLRAYIAPR